MSVWARGIGAALLALGVARTALAQEPAWLTAAREREGVLLTPREIRSNDGFFRAQVPAALVGEVQAVEGAYVLRLDASTGAPIECVVFRQDLDLAGYLQSATQRTYELIEQAQGKVGARAVERVDSGSVGPAPYLALQWIHRVEPEGGQPLVGALKLVAATTGRHTIYCAHDEVGYSETFWSVASALIRTIRYEDSTKESPHRQEIHTMTLQGNRVGFQCVSYTRDGDGDIRIRSTTAMLIPVDSQTLVASDQASIHWARPDGTLINAYMIESANGVVETELRLDPRDGGSWGVSGTFKTKAFQATIPRGEPSTELRDELLLRARLAEPAPVGAAVTVQTWAPSIDPGRLLEQTVTVVEDLGDGRFAAHVTMEGLSFGLITDRRGGTLSSTVSLGPLAVETQRVYEDGSI